MTGGKMRDKTTKLLNDMEDIKNTVEYEAKDSMFRNNVIDHLESAITQAHKIEWLVEGDRNEAEGMKDDFFRTSEDILTDEADRRYEQEREEIIFDGVNNE
jgi:hypothetical protein